MKPSLSEVLSETLSEADFPLRTSQACCPQSCCPLKLLRKSAALLGTQFFSTLAAQGSRKHFLFLFIYFFSLSLSLSLSPPLSHSPLALSLSIYLYISLSLSLSLSPSLCPPLSLSSGPAQPEASPEYNIPFQMSFGDCGGLCWRQEPDEVS